MANADWTGDLMELTTLRVFCEIALARKQRDSMSSDSALLENSAKVSWIREAIKASDATRSQVEFEACWRKGAAWGDIGESSDPAGS